MAAVMLVVVVRRERDTGGQAVLDRREYRSWGSSRVPEEWRVSGNAYRESRWSSVMVRRYGDEYAIADSMPFVEGGWV